MNSEYKTPHPDPHDAQKYHLFVYADASNRATGLKFILEFPLMVSILCVCEKRTGETKSMVYAGSCEPSLLADALSTKLPIHLKRLSLQL